jgi:hypothetical protein
MGCIISIIGALVSVTGCTPLPPQTAASVLAPYAYVAPAPPAQGPGVVTAGSTPVVAQRPAPRRLDGTPLSQPPIVYGIPYPWTPLTWAILHAGRTQ